jgi:hypothetical protein
MYPLFLLFFDQPKNIIESIVRSHKARFLRDVDNLFESRISLMTSSIMSALSKHGHPSASSDNVHCTEGNPTGNTFAIQTNTSASIPSRHDADTAGIPSCHDTDSAGIPIRHDADTVCFPSRHDADTAGIPSRHDADSAGIPRCHDADSACIPSLHDADSLKKSTGGSRRDKVIDSMHEEALVDNGERRMVVFASLAALVNEYAPSCVNEVVPRENTAQHSRDDPVSVSSPIVVDGSEDISTAGKGSVLVGRHSSSEFTIASHQVVDNTVIEAQVNVEEDRQWVCLCTCYTHA